MKAVFTSLLLFFLFSTTHAQISTFARGADVSWVTEMENEGKKFYNNDGQAA